MYSIVYIEAMFPNKYILKEVWSWNVKVAEQHCNEELLLQAEAKAALSYPDGLSFGSLFITFLSQGYQCITVADDHRPFPNSISWQRAPGHHFPAKTRNYVGVLLEMKPISFSGEDTVPATYPKPNFGQWPLERVCSHSASMPPRLRASQSIGRHYVATFSSKTVSMIVPRYQL